MMAFICLPGELDSLDTFWAIELNTTTVLGNNNVRAGIWMERFTDWLALPSVTPPPMGPPFPLARWFHITYTQHCLLLLVVLQCKLHHYWSHLLSHIDPTVITALHHCLANPAPQKWLILLLLPKQIAPWCKEPRGLIPEVLVPERWCGTPTHSAKASKGWKQEGETESWQQ